MKKGNHLLKTELENKWSRSLFAEECSFITGRKATHSNGVYLGDALPYFRLYLSFNRKLMDLK